MTHLRLIISGMTGPGCQEKIERVVKELPGVSDAVTCLGGYVDLEYEEVEVDAERIIETIRSAGYQVGWGG